MILDSSAVIAVVFREKQHEQLEEFMATADSLAIGAPTLFETSMVAIGLYEWRGHDLVAHFLEERGVEVIPFDDRHWRSPLMRLIAMGRAGIPPPSILVTA